MKTKVLIIGLTLLSVLSAKAQLVEHQVLPSTTDSNINGNNPPHYAYLDNSVNQINKLLLFIPGTNATPWDYRMFQQTAANLGYHSIGLSTFKFAQQRKTLLVTGEQEEKFGLGKIHTTQLL